MAFPLPRELRGLRPLDGVFPAQLGRAREMGPRGRVPDLLKLENGAPVGEGVAITLGITTKPLTVARDKIRTTALLPMPRAKITWGNGDARQQIIIDFVSGTSISLVLATLGIEAFYEVLAPPWGEEDPCDVTCMPVYEVSAAVGYGSAGSWNTYTAVAFVEEAEGSVRVPIPAFAKTFTILPVDNATVSAHIRFPASYYDVEDVVVTPLTNLSQTNSLDQLPIFASARWIEIENRGEQEQSTTFVVFGLGV